MSGPPPPPPPHGEMPRSSGLPPGKYDIFVIPPHSAGAGFLYLPSLRPSSNSFAAGFASALILVALFQSMAPAFRAWWESFQGLGNMGITLLVVGVGFGAWAFGRAQKDSPGHHGYKANGHPPGGGAQSTGGGFGASTSTPPPQPGSGRPPPPPHGSSSAPPPPPPQPEDSNPRTEDEAPPAEETAPPPPRPEKAKPWSQQRPPPQPTPKSKGTWEKAREEMRRKEEERKAKEAEQKRRDEATRRLAELRAKEAKERQEREKEKVRKEKEAREKKERELAEVQRRKLAEEQRQKLAAERLEKEAKGGEAQATESAAKPRVGSSYAYSAVGEKTNMWPNGRPTVAPSQAGSTASKAASSSAAEKRPPAPTAKTYVGTDDDAYSYRPQSGKRWGRRPSVSSVGGSESSWAPSHTTTRTSPPPSVRGPYSTKDPDKIVIQAVYLFMNQFAKTPASQLVSGVGSVTDGLILRMTTEGLFIDDDVRGVPQREWDVKAWTLKHVEAWCPPHCLKGAASVASGNNKSSAPHLLYKMATARRNGDKDRQQLTGDEADAYLTEMLRSCRECCRLGLCKNRFGNASIQSPSGQAGEWRDKGLHVLRATIRDQEAKRYLFVLDEAEGWKMAVGLQRLRRGTQVRQLGVSGMAPSEARSTLEMLGWAG
ncbi:hypothetical protein XA68_13553 [Ophiocordyceps unilateralis]|uniref:Trans-sialidase-like protein n=1 Tax=Ophiocordyceps unilateralis TaxID=268505 RepID=A0A2A9PCB1_OPHUN|nr:hypothetical protein XA68_13553 [Ophiocordyceps unilateralis]